MKSPQDMRIIQIDVTNACIHNCSNCTRFCGHHKKPFFMDFDVFIKAVDSMEGYVGTVSLMGGEPTLHPQFEKMIYYLAEKYPRKRSDSPMKFPQVSFLDTIHEIEMENTFLYPCMAESSGNRQTINGPGLWSAMGNNYKKYYEIIQDSIDYQALNDHSMPMYHQPALISRKALGVSDRDWIKLRDDCWIQNMWSACITPKGAFFCEVAGALDMLFNGPGGWPIEPGWWKRTPEEFGEQLQWCEFCGLSLKTFSRDANEEIDDVSPDLYEKLKEVGSRKVGTPHINVLDIQNGIISQEDRTLGRWFEGSMPYTESYAAKFEAATESLSYKKIKKVELKDASVKIGSIIADELEKENHNIYLLLLIGDVLEKEASSRMEQLVLNPGTLMYRYENSACEDDYFRFFGEGYTMLLCGKAASIEKIGWERIRAIHSPEEIVELWNPNKIVSFVPQSEYHAIGSRILPQKKYLVYGAGETANAAIRHIQDIGAECVRLVDRDNSKWGKNILGIEITSPAFIDDNRDEFDYILIASTKYFCDIRDYLFEKGFSKEQICWWV